MPIKILLQPGDLLISFTELSDLFLPPLFLNCFLLRNIFSHDRDLVLKYHNLVGFRIKHTQILIENFLQVLMILVDLIFSRIQLGFLKKL